MSGDIFLMSEGSVWELISRRFERHFTEDIEMEEADVEGSGNLQ